MRKVVFVLGLALLAGALAVTWRRAPRLGTTPDATSRAASPGAASRPPAPFPMFRGGPSLAGRVEAIPSAVRRLWRVDTGAAIDAGAVAAGGRVFCLNRKGRLLALDAGTGARVWAFEAGERCTATPLFLDVDGRPRLFFGSGKGRLLAVDAASGARVWSVAGEERIAGACSWVRQGGRAFVLYGDYGGKLHCLAATDGQVRWRAAAGDAINGTPAVEDGRVVFGGCDGVLRVLDAATGREVLALDLGSPVPSSPAAAGSLAWVALHGSTVCAVDLAAGKRLWAYKGEKVGSFFAAPAVGDAVVVAADDGGRIHVLDRTSGAARHVLPLSGGVRSEPLVDGERLLVADRDGILYCFHLESGRELWRLRHGPAIVAPLAVCGGVVYVGDRDGALTAYAPAPSGSEPRRAAPR